MEVLGLRLDEEDALTELVEDLMPVTRLPLDDHQILELYAV